MLPYALKIVWFALSLSGLLSCWVVLGALAIAVGSYWGPLLYCIGCTILEGVFCLGLIWRMNPFLMPRAFCIAQTILIGFGTFLLTGVCATFSIVSSLAIMKPETWGFNGDKALAWRPVYTLPTLIFPLIASAVQISVIVKLDATRPADGLQCDATNPVWVRFLGYAGIPLAFSLPFSVFFLLSIIRVYKAQHQIVTSSRNLRHINHDSSSNLTALPPRRTHRKDLGRGLGLGTLTPPIPTPRAIPSPSPSLAYPPQSPGRAPISPGFSSPALSARQFHLPFTGASATAFDGSQHDPLGTSHSSTVEDPQEFVLDSPVSSAFPTFAPPSNPGTPPNPRESPGHGPTEYLKYYGYKHDWPEVQGRVRYYSPASADVEADWDNDDVSSIRWTHHRDGDYDIHEEFRRKETDVESFEEDYVIIGEQGVGSYVARSLRATPTSGSQLQTQARFNTDPQPLRRIVIFQLSFNVVLFLAFISTLIDVIAQHTRPSPFGTQHVALLLAAWGPVFVFGTHPSIRQTITFWLPRNKQ